MSLLISASISALTALDILIIFSSVMDIFCDNSGCTNSLASAISLLFEELVSESDRESKGSDLAFFYVYSFRRGRVANANMSLLYRGRLIIGHLIYCQFTFNVTKMSTPNKSMCIQNVNRINGGHNTHQYLILF